MSTYSFTTGLFWSSTIIVILFFKAKSQVSDFGKFKNDFLAIYPDDSTSASAF